MSETDYNARLYEKMKAEQDKYRDWLLHQEPSEIHPWCPNFCLLKLVPVFLHAVIVTEQLY